MAKVSLQEKLEFIEHIVMRHRSGECLLWPYGRGSGGYPFLDPSTRVHRYLCHRADGPPPSAKHDAAHTCGVRSCVNLLHLRWKTRRENLADKLLHGTHSHGERAPLAKLTNQQAEAIRNSKESPFTLAWLYQVTPETIRNIQTGRTFKKAYCPI